MMLPLKKLRDREGLTQAALSKKLKTSPSTIGMWEQGRREPDCEMLKRIADYFNVSTDYLLGREDKTNTLSDLQSALLNKFSMLNGEGQNTLMNVLDGLNLLHASQNQKISSVVQNNKIKNNYGAVGNFNAGVTVG